MPTKLLLVPPPQIFRPSAILDITVRTKTRLKIVCTMDDKFLQFFKYEIWWKYMMTAWQLPKDCLTTTRRNIPKILNKIVSKIVHEIVHKIDVHTKLCMKLSMKICIYETVPKIVHQFSTKPSHKLTFKLSTKLYTKVYTKSFRVYPKVTNIIVNEWLFSNLRTTDRQQKLRA